MTMVSNKSPGPRGFNVPDGAGGMRQLILAPGQTAEVDLEGAAHPVFAGMIRNCDLVIAAPTIDADRQGERDAAADRILALASKAA